MPSGINEAPYEKLRQIILLCDKFAIPNYKWPSQFFIGGEESKSEEQKESRVQLHISLFKAMCFQLMDCLLYEDYFGCKFKHNTHHIVENLKVPADRKEFDSLFEIFDKREGDIRHLLFSADTHSQTVRTLEKFASGWN